MNRSFVKYSRTQEYLTSHLLKLLLCNFLLKIAKFSTRKRKEEGKIYLKAAYVSKLLESTVIENDIFVD